MTQVFGAAPPDPQIWRDLVAAPAPADAPAPLTQPPLALSCPNWPARDQEMRNTCVPFAASAAMELFWHLRGTQVQLSPDFMYNQMREALDPAYLAYLAATLPGYAQGATLLAQAGCVLRDIGCCPEEDRPYRPARLTQGINGTPPTPAQLSAAAPHRHGAFYYAHMPNVQGPRLVPAPTGGAPVTVSQAIAALIALNSPVAVALPVFALPSGRDTWTMPSSWRHGAVPYPGADPQLDGATTTPRGGHAVCITGWGHGPQGDWFLFRNSWGLGFHTSALPRPYMGGCPMPAGYGVLSAAAVNRYVWEILAPTDIDYGTPSCCAPPVA